MGKPLITIVLVVYREKLANLEVYPLLQKLSQEENYHLVIYDNSPDAQENPLAAADYYHAANNPGLAKAYNYAWACAKKLGSQALLLLDQDTQVTADFFDQLAKTDLENVTVPLAFSDGKQISPVQVTGMITGETPTVAPGLYTEHIMAINSGSLVPLTVLEKTNGFNEEFPLDYLDHWFYWKVATLQLPVRVIDYKLQHHLSVMDYARISIKRYQSIAAGEKLFYQKYDQTLLPAYRKHLLPRIVKQFLTVKNRQIWKITWRIYRSLGEKA